MSKMFGVRLSDEDAARLDNLIYKRKTTPQECLKAVILDYLAQTERNWVKQGLDWMLRRPTLVTRQMETPKRVVTI